MQLKINLLHAIFMMALGLMITNNTHGQQQRFFGGIKAGMNFAQIDGDGVFGFNKFAYNAGFMGGFKLKKITELQIEMLYSLRGSRYGRHDPPFTQFSLHYLEIPVIFCVKDWLNEEGETPYYRMQFQGGFSFGRLINSSSYSGDDQYFKKNDLSWIGGINYYYTRNWAVSARYTSSLTPLYRYIKNGQSIKMISYFISLGLNYRFN